ncbi:DUF11 domain-containing protein, partial [Enterococcus faecalis]|uniref:DUF11 domain-containing protein n=1 Tax=Enterococcus faecalis TaxID=1351 RepID=UPI0034D01B95
MKKKFFFLLLILAMINQYTLPVTSLAYEESTSQAEKEAFFNENKEKVQNGTEVETKTSLKDFDSSEKIPLESRISEYGYQPTGPPESTFQTNSKQSNNVVWSLETESPADNAPTYISKYQFINNQFTRTFSQKLASNYNTPNQLATKDNELFFFTRSGDLVRIDQEGNVLETTHVPELLGTVRSADFDMMGNYISFSDPGLSGQKEASVYKYNVVSKNLDIVKLKDPLNLISKGILFYIGDIAISSDNIAYAVGSSTDGEASVIKINLNNDTIIDYFQPKGLKHSPAVAFLDDGTLIFSENSTKNVYISDFKSGVTEMVGTIGLPGNSVDFARGSYPNDFPILSPPNLIVSKLGPDQSQVGEVYTYTIEVKNIGDEPSTNTIIKDSLPSGVSYVPSSTKLNGIGVQDISGGSALFQGSGMSINSPNRSSGEVYTDYPAVISFQVKVNEESAGKTIVNMATVTSRQITNPVNSNQVQTNIPGI